MQSSLKLWDEVEIDVSVLGRVHTVKVPLWGGTQNASLATLKKEWLRHVGLALTNVRYDTVQRSMAV